TYYTGGRSSVDGEEQGQEPSDVRLGVTAALSLSRHQSIKLYGSTGVYHRTDSKFWALGIAWQYRWGGGLWPPKPRRRSTGWRTERLRLRIRVGKSDGVHRRRVEIVLRQRTMIHRP